MKKIALFCLILSITTLPSLAQDNFLEDEWVEEESYQIDEEMPNSETLNIGGSIDFSGVFRASPFIYSILGLMSAGSLGIALYQFLSLKNPSNSSFESSLKKLLETNQRESLLALCNKNASFISQMLIPAFKEDLSDKELSMRVEQEGKALASSYWHKLALLNDIAMLAPMLGLLGTVLGLFYAFYGMGQTSDSLSSLFDGLGISIGTTVAGLIVAIFSMLLHSYLKYSLMNFLSQTEKKAVSYLDLLSRKNENS